MKRGLAFVLLVCPVLLCHFDGLAQEKNKLESWYTYWGLGYANPSYPDELDAAIDELEALDPDHVSVGLDLLGFYGPVSQQTIVGGIINAFGDRYEIGGAELQINGYTFSASTMHFINDTIGRGIFIRADLGFSRFVFDSNVSDDETSDWGVGGLIGGGFGFNISPGTRLLLNVNYALRRVEGENAGTLGVTVGGLF